MSDDVEDLHALIDAIPGVQPYAIHWQGAEPVFAPDGRTLPEETVQAVADAVNEWRSDERKALRAGRQAAEAADRDVEALIASEMRAAAIARVLARDDVPADVRARLIEKQGR
jgi:hypothetical protein